MSGGPEWEYVEEPFLDQLALMGWKVITGSLDEPSVTGRESFREVLMTSDLRRALLKVNQRTDDKGGAIDWLDDTRIAQAVSALERIGHKKLMEANEEATALLLSGVQVDGVNGWDGGRAQTIHFIDWDHPENNTFTAVSQFKVACPGGRAKASIRPDITLFINGIPVVVIECKSPTVNEPIAAAVDQLRRYHNARFTTDEVDAPEGNEQLFYTNQFLIATSFDEAKVGTIGADARYYLEWKDTAPATADEVKAELAQSRLSSQHRLIAGMLRPSHLLDIIRHFTLFNTVSGKTVKIVCRYQQFRAVHAAVRRLQTGKTRAEDGEHDRRGGIVWHTQGSGKSLTMVFLVKKMRSIPALRRFKIVVVTDRKDLERQLSGTAELTGETVKRARRVSEVKQLLSQKGPGIVFAMIQKMQDRDLKGLSPGDALGDLGLLNDDDAILVMVDEAHRSHSNSLHGNLLQALPNCARIGFTGTPIIMGQKKRTHEIFGEFIDRYTIKQAEADGATVPILYEGRTAEGAVSDGRDLDELFEDLFGARTEAELEAIKRKYGTKGSIFEAEKLIEAKAADMLNHYVAHILPSGLKAQVVAYSRRASVRYQAAFEKARDELVAAAEALDARERSLDDLELAERPRKLGYAVRAHRSLDELKALQFAAIISPDNNDPPEWSNWSDAAKIESHIARFKKPLRGEGSDALSFLIVKSMLLTGFDAPIEGVMYLDRSIREAELLQAIARVNRTGHDKTAGILVDYFGVAKHLSDALSAYTADDIHGALESLEDEIPKLRDRHARVMGIFESRDVDPKENTDAAIELLADEKLRATFRVALKQFLSTLDLVLPRPEGLPFVNDAKVLGEIYDRARRLYRTDDLPQLSKSVGRKVQRLIDEHVISLGIDPKIPPIAITDAKFAAHVSRKISDRAKASEMEHAARSHIRKKLDEDPVYYQGLSDRLEEILQKHDNDWKQMVLALTELTEEIQRGRQQDDALGLEPELHAPFFDVLVEERRKEAVVNASDKTWLAQITKGLVDRLVKPAAQVVDFWKNGARQDELRAQVFDFLDSEAVVDFDRADEVADRLMQLAKSNAHKLTEKP